MGHLIKWLFIKIEFDKLMIKNGTMVVFRLMKRQLDSNYRGSVPVNHQSMSVSL